jgi:hypothetical protein
MYEVVTRIAIEAPTEAAWAVLTDFVSFPEWNDFIQQIKGEVREGAWLEVRIRMQGASPMTFHPRVRMVRPAREFRWRGHLIVPGLFDGEHFFLLEPNVNGTEFTHGERFSGVVAGLLKSRMVRRLEKSFAAFNRAFKARVEDRQRTGAA